MPSLRLHTAQAPLFPGTLWVLFASSREERLCVSIMLLLLQSPLPATKEQQGKGVAEFHEAGEIARSDGRWLPGRRQAETVVANPVSGAIPEPVGAVEAALVDVEPGAAPKYAILA